MAKIIKNTTNSLIAINDTGISVSANSSYTIPPQDYLLWAASSDVITYIGSGSIVVNDGNNDLNISDGTDHIKGIFPVIPFNTISTSNSSTTPLGANSTFTGSWINVLSYNLVIVNVRSDKASADNGVIIEWSSDGINTDAIHYFNHEGTHGDHWSFGIDHAYFRVNYTNGTQAQTYLRLQTILKPYNQKASSIRIDDSIDSDDVAQLTKSVITGKTPGGVFLNVALDNDGRLLISGQSELLSPLPSIKIRERRVLTSSGVYAFTQTIAQATAIKEFSFGGRGPGEGMFGRYVASTETFVPGGNFESSGQVALWSNTGLGDGLALVPTYSTDQAFTGTGSLKLGPASRSDSNHYPEVTYTFSTAISLDYWRYVTVRFYNFAPTGGAVTRTISIRLTDTAGTVRIYSVAGLTNASPFNANQWIQILGEIRIPTSQVGTTFDINNVASISLRMVDSGNKSYTAIYWDSVKFIGAIDILQKIYVGLGDTNVIHFDPVETFAANEVMYLAMRNNDTTSKEYQITVAGVDLT